MYNRGRSKEIQQQPSTSESPKNEKQDWIGPQARQERNLCRRMDVSRKAVQPVVPHDQQGGSRKDARRLDEALRPPRGKRRLRGDRPKGQGTSHTCLSDHGSTGQGQGTSRRRNHVGDMGPLFGCVGPVDQLRLRASQGSQRRRGRHGRNRRRFLVRSRKNRDGQRDDQSQAVHVVEVVETAQSTGQRVDNDQEAPGSAHDQRNL